MGEAGNLDMPKGSCTCSEAKMKCKDIPRERERAFIKLFLERRTVPLYNYDMSKSYIKLFHSVRRVRNIVCTYVYQWQF